MPCVEGTVPSAAGARPVWILGTLNVNAAGLTSGFTPLLLSGQ